MLFETYNEEKYRKFTSAEEATAWGEEHYGKWATWYKDQMSSVYPLDSTALKQYLGESYKHINPILRSNVTLLGNNGSGTDNHYLAKAEVLDTTLCLAPRVPENIVVYRHVSMNTLRCIIQKTHVELSKIRDGMTDYDIPYYEKGFLSTSLWPGLILDEAKGREWLKIYVKAGTPGVYVNNVDEKDEQELLINRGMTLSACSEQTSNEIIAQQQITVHRFKCIFNKKK